MRLSTVLQGNKNGFFEVIPGIGNSLVKRLDLSSSNIHLTSSPEIYRDTSTFEAYITTCLSGAAAGVGGYGEDRIIYRRSGHFGGEEPRTVHLGVDIWTAAGTPVHAPLPGTVHSFRDNAGFGDYGPTVILAHELDGVPFYTLYGHLSRRSLAGLEPGRAVAGGAAFAEIGPWPENGDWPAHLHFQVMADMQGRQGDFPGVAAPSRSAEFLALCPDPNLILQIPVL